MLFFSPEKERSYFLSIKHKKKCGNNKREISEVVSKILVKKKWSWVIMPSSRTRRHTVSSTVRTAPHKFVPFSIFFSFAFFPPELYREDALNMEKVAKQCM